MDIDVIESVKCDVCGEEAAYRTVAHDRPLCPGCADQAESTGTTVAELHGYCVWDLGFHAQCGDPAVMQVADLPYCREHGEHEYQMSLLVGGPND